ncbi:MAG: AEC family transporter [Anaerolineales bacterium]|nr:AEC family transporter [Anaerolineales bacterium]
MDELLRVFLDNLFPIIIVAGAGFLLQRLLLLDPRPLVSLSYFILLPALQFIIVIDSKLGGRDVMRIILLASTVIALCLLIAWLATRALKLPASLTAAVLVTAAFMNAGNYGLSLNQLAFRDDGLAWASIFFVTITLWANALGVFILTAGKSTIRHALTELVKVPALYGILAALFFKLLPFGVPSPIYRAMDLLAAATITVMLLVLGMQIGKSGLPVHPGPLMVVIAIRLVLSPGLTWLISPAFSLPPLARSTSIVEAGMPSAVLTSILALKFDVEPDFVTGAVFISTILSPLTLTPLLSLLQ